MGGMLETLRNALKIPDLRKKIVMTVVMLLIFRIGAHIPVPGFNPEKFKTLIENGGSIAGFMDIISGGAFKQASIFAMSITPYINASIIMQLLTVAIPKLEQLQKEGEEGRKQIQKYVRYGTVLLGFIQAVGLYVTLSSALTDDMGVLPFFTVTLTFTAGTAFLMWLGEKINDVGIGNGISLIIFAGILSRGPSAAMELYELQKLDALGKGVISYFSIALILASFIALIAGVVWVQQAERRIPVQYAKRVVGRKVYGGQNTHIPIKVNSAGVIPIIFAMSIIMFPATILQFFAPNADNWFIREALTPTGKIYALMYAILVIFFTFFYTVMVFNPVELSNNLKKNGGFIPGIRPGKPTSDYIAKILNRITWFNAFFLAFITVLPNVLSLIFDKIPNIWFAGTGLLIMVGVALDTVKQIESQMLMRHYKGFLE
ncbi:MAG: preprotein translocase subunit SecY [Clostridiales bacterium]